MNNKNTIQNVTDDDRQTSTDDTLYLRLDRQYGRPKMDGNALERYRQQYEQEYGDSEVFESGEDEIDASKFENPNLYTQQKQQQMPIESYYTERCSRRYSRCSDES